MRLATNTQHHMSNCHETWAWALTFDTLSNTSECHKVPGLQHRTILHAFPNLHFATTPKVRPYGPHREQLRTVANGWATLSEDTSALKQEPFATHSGKNKQHAPFLGIMNTPSHTDLILFSATSDHVCLLQFDIEADPNLWNSEHLLDEKLASGFDSPCRNKRSCRIMWI